MRSGHLQTVWAGLLRRVPATHYDRTRIDTPDGDFLDLDRVSRGRRRVAVVTHGLEGSSGRPYMRGMAAALDQAGWDVIAWNCRGCSGEPNRLLRSYHSGATEDLDIVVETALAEYEQVVLVGFSLGGNMTLKYLGERERDPRIRAAVAFSVPCDLKAGSERLAHSENRPYMYWFMRSLRAKVREKAVMYPDALDLAGLDRIRTFREFDDRYTAPIHGFRDAEDYWARCSCRQFVQGIRVPTLLVSALDDPFLAESCYPVAEARASDFLRLEVPRFGGHVAFLARGRTWSERRAVEFLGGEATG